MKALIIILLSGITLNTYSQIPDTVFQNKETVTLVSKTASTLQQRSPYLVPASGIIYGIVSQNSRFLRGIDREIREEFQEGNPNFSTRIDDHLQYMPAVSVYALGFMGVKGRNNMIDKTAMYFISNTLTGITVGTLKTETHKLRPDGSDHRSFPSGHTAAAFAAAEFMNQEYKDLSPWYSVAAYSMATATGTLRMLNNKHWLSDVVMGAGVGILSTKLTYKVYPIVKRKLGFNKRPKLMIVPNYQPGFYGFSMAARLN